VVGIEHDPATARTTSERTRRVPAGTAGASHAQRGTWRGGLLVGRAASGVLETHHPEARQTAPAWATPGYTALRARRQPRRPQDFYAALVRTGTAPNDIVESVPAAAPTGRIAVAAHA
jgi:hypothetical protein